MSAPEDLWSNLPIDLLDIILWRLPLIYHPHFASTCNNWKSVCNHKLHCIKQTPLLIHVKSWEKNVFNYYSPALNKTFTVESPLMLCESQFYSSKNGWLVLHKRLPEEEVQVVLVNPTTNISYSYPGLLRDYFFTGITFSGCPGKEDFVIFAITNQEYVDDYVSICIWRQGEWKLQSAGYDSQMPFIMARWSSPVVHGGNFYCVSEDGKLGVFNPEKDTWNILTRPKGFYFPKFGKKQVYLIESEGRIIAVVGGNHDPRVLIFCLDYGKMAWEKN